MDLKTYMKTYEVTAKELSEKTTLLERYIKLISTGALKAGKKAAQLLHMATNGEVTHQELLELYEKRSVKCECCGQKIKHVDDEGES